MKIEEKLWFIRIFLESIYFRLGFSIFGLLGYIIYVKVDNEILDYKDLVVILKVKVIYDIECLDFIIYEFFYILGYDDK